MTLIKKQSENSLKSGSYYSRCILEISVNKKIFVEKSQG